MATDEVSGGPEGDAVTQVSVAILPGASTRAEYRSELVGNCSVASAAPRRDRPVAPAGALLVAALGLGMRARRRREVR